MSQEELSVPSGRSAAVRLAVHLAVEARRRTNEAVTEAEATEAGAINLTSLAAGALKAQDASEAAARSAAGEAEHALAAAEEGAGVRRVALQVAHRVGRAPVRKGPEAIVAEAHLASSRA